MLQSSRLRCESHGGSPDAADSWGYRYRGGAALIRLNSNNSAITVFAPAFSDDGQWHEFYNGEVRGQHLGAELIEGLLSAHQQRTTSQNDDREIMQKGNEASGPGAN